MLKKLENILLELDVNTAETRVFKANLETGPATASAIASHAGLGRVTTYETLKRLSKKGLVRTLAKKSNSVKYFTAVSVTELEEKLKMRGQAVSTALGHLTELKPLLSQMYSNIHDKPLVLYFEGLPEIKEALYDIIQQKPKELFAFSNSEYFNDVYGLKFLEKYWAKRKQAGIVARGIIPRTEKALKFYNKEQNQKDLRVVRYIPVDWYKFNDNINIYGSNVQITSLQPGNEHTVIIRSRSIARAFRFIFELVWNTIALEK